MTCLLQLALLDGQQNVLREKADTLSLAFALGKIVV